MCCMDTAHLPMMHSRLSHFFRLATPSLVPRRVSILPPVLALLRPPLCSPAPHSGSEDTFFDVTFSDCCCDGTGKPFKLICQDMVLRTEQAVGACQQWRRCQHSPNTFLRLSRCALPKRTALRRRAWSTFHLIFDESTGRAGHCCCHSRGRSPSRYGLGGKLGALRHNYATRRTVRGELSAHHHVMRSSL